MPTVRVDDWQPGVRRLTLDRPPANAIDAILLTDLVTALDDAASDSEGRVVERPFVPG